MHPCYAHIHESYTAKQDVGQALRCLPENQIQEMCLIHCLHLNNVIGVFVSKLHTCVNPTI